MHAHNATTGYCLCQIKTFIIYFLFDWVSGVIYKNKAILQWMCSILCEAVLHCVLIKLLGDTYPGLGVNEPPQLSTVVTFKATQLCLAEDKMKWGSMSQQWEFAARWLKVVVKTLSGSKRLRWFSSLIFLKAGAIWCGPYRLLVQSQHFGSAADRKWNYTFKYVLMRVAIIRRLKDCLAHHRVHLKSLLLRIWPHRRFDVSRAKHLQKYKIL